MYHTEIGTMKLTSYDVLHLSTSPPAAAWEAQTTGRGLDALDLARRWDVCGGVADGRSLGAVGRKWRWIVVVTSTRSSGWLEAVPVVVGTTDLAVVVGGCDAEVSLTGTGGGRDNWWFKEVVE